MIIDQACTAYECGVTDVRELLDCAGRARQIIVGQTIASESENDNNVPQTP